MNKNETQYINDIQRAVRDMVIRCGGDFPDKLPEKFFVRQKELFVHSGITILLSNGMADHDHDLISMFNCVLGYFVSKTDENKDNRYKSIVSMLTAIIHHAVSTEGSLEDPPNESFFDFADILGAASAVLCGTVTTEEMRDISCACRGVVQLALQRERELLRKDSEKN